MERFLRGVLEGIHTLEANRPGERRCGVGARRFVGARGEWPRVPYLSADDLTPLLNTVAATDPRAAASTRTACSTRPFVRLEAAGSWPRCIARRAAAGGGVAVASQTDRRGRAWLTRRGARAILGAGHATGGRALGARWATRVARGHFAWRPASGWRSSSPRAAGWRPRPAARSRPTPTVIGDPDGVGSGSVPRWQPRPCRRGALQSHGPPRARRRRTCVVAMAAPVPRAPCSAAFSPASPPPRGVRAPARIEATRRVTQWAGAVMEAGTRGVGADRGPDAAPAPGVSAADAGRTPARTGRGEPRLLASPGSPRSCSSIWGGCAACLASPSKHSTAGRVRSSTPTGSFPSASLFKLPVMYQVYRQRDAGRLTSRSGWCSRRTTRSLIWARWTYRWARRSARGGVGAHDRGERQRERQPAGRPRGLAEPNATTRDLGLGETHLGGDRLVHVAARHGAAVGADRPWAGAEPFERDGDVDLLLAQRVNDRLARPTAARHAGGAQDGQSRRHHPRRGDRVMRPARRS